MQQLQVTETTIKTVLTRATSGFLLNSEGRAPVCSHSLQPYQGCAFGNSLCGVGCYVRANVYVTKRRPWGSFLEVRMNASDSYRSCYASERRWAEAKRGKFSVFCSSSTDPFVPQEDRYGITKSILEAMLELPPDLLILQTHTHRVVNYSDLYQKLAQKCELRFHISIETDRDNMPGLPNHASPVEKRLAACRQLKEAGHRVVVMVAPLLPIHDPDSFFGKLAEVADAVVIDHFIVGDGTPDGRNTKRTALPASMAQIKPESLSLDYRNSIVTMARKHLPGRVGISMDGFVGFYE